MTMYPHTRRSGPMGLEIAFFCDESPLRARCRTQSRLWVFQVRRRELLWCLNGLVAESGKRYLGNAGLIEIC